MRIEPAISASTAAADASFVVSMQVVPDYSAAAHASSRPLRKQAAVDALSAAEAASLAHVAPQLDRLRSSGLVTSWESIPLTGTLVVHGDARQAGALGDALRGISELSNVDQNALRVATVTSGFGGADPKLEDEASAMPGIIGADAAWKSGVDGRGVVVGFVDSGADGTHEALATRYRGYRAGAPTVDDHNFYNAMEPDKQHLFDGWGHGTGTASLAVGTGAAHPGVAPGATFIEARAFGAGTTDLTTKLRAMAWMLAPRDSSGTHPDPTLAPDVVNMSFGAHDGEGLRMRTVLEAMEAAGIVAVAAAGNGGRGGPGTVLMPSAYPTVLAVGATDTHDQLDPTTAVGPGPIVGPHGERLQKPDIAAPGAGILGATRGGGYAIERGTSMASAVASGAAALLLQKYPQLTPAQVREALRSTAVDVGPTGVDARSGAGRIDVSAALTRAGELLAAR